ncbi:lipoprotein [Pseudomonas saudimassiliensis]|uniref:Lipoprotein n=1 Tax=Pseudomonas saudimassiliensis TaxID=1461581 RepID=A0A078MA60_9PSED|nr:hypothetical protein [Pseudomonas saudimassiliensis]CEA02302.1 lipoprotein [Pseudomonas saudimassiliensis]CEF25794.1 lipoprotein [Pseudomonas saudimassiliensis]
MRHPMLPWALWLCAGLTLVGCSSQPQPPGGVATRVERELVSHNLLIDAGEQLVLTSPQRTIRVTEQQLHRVTEFDARDRVANSHESHQSLPWDDQPVILIAEDRRFTLRTNHDGVVRLNLLDEQFIDLDFTNLRTIQLVARANPTVVAEQTLLISRELRAVLREAVALVYDNLEESGVEQWVYRIHRLNELGLEEESNQLENMLMVLTIADPELQYEFLQALNADPRP